MHADMFADLPREVALRMLGEVITWTGNEGPVELGKLEAFHEAMEKALAESCDEVPPHLGRRARHRRPRQNHRRTGSAAQGGPKKVAEPLNHASI